MVTEGQNEGVSEEDKKRKKKQTGDGTLISAPSSHIDANGQRGALLGYCHCGFEGGRQLHNLGE
jgi:hypothetical protein